MQIDYAAQIREISISDNGTLLNQLLLPPILSIDTVLRDYISKREWGLAFLNFQSFGVDDYPYCSLFLASWDGPLASSLKPWKLIEQRSSRKMSISLEADCGIRVQSPAIPPTSILGYPALDKLYTINSALSAKEIE